MVAQLFLMLPCAPLKIICSGPYSLVMIERYESYYFVLSFNPLGLLGGCIKILSSNIRFRPGTFGMFLPSSFVPKHCLS